MNKITCSFDDEAQFHQHIVKSTGSDQVAISTISQERLRVFEQVSIRLNVDNVKATNQVLGRVIRRKPIASQSKNESKAWEYTVRLDAQDKVWFKAFVDEVNTRSKFCSIHPPVVRMPIDNLPR